MDHSSTGFSPLENLFKHIRIPFGLRMSSDGFLQVSIHFLRFSYNFHPSSIFFPHFPHIFRRFGQISWGLLPRCPQFLPEDSLSPALRPITEISQRWDVSRTFVEQHQCLYGGFLNGGTPIAGWFLLGKIPSRNGWWLGVPLFQETSISSWKWVAFSLQMNNHD